MQQFRMSRWQRGILLGMYLVSCRMDRDTEVWFTRRALEHLMWFDWHGYHTQKMDELIKWKWIVNSRNESNSIIYKLSASARGQISIDFSMALANCHYIEPQERLL